MTISDESAAPSRFDDIARLTSRVPVIWLGIAGVFALAIALRAVVPFNVDVSWWLIVAERVFDGQRLYVDILETNPPMAGVVYFASVAIARLLGIRPEIAANLLIFGMIAASMVMTWRLLRGSYLHAQPAAGPLAIWAAVLLTILPMYDFGQREHLALITLLPALAVYIRRSACEPVTPAAIILAGLSAALTVSFKPHFVFAVGACVIAAACLARSWRIALAPENWVAGGLGVLYGVATYVVFPEYFTVIYPLVRDVYLLLKAPIEALLLTGAMGLWAVAMSVILLLPRRRRFDPALVVLSAASAGFVAAFLMQQKGWGYHAYPMVALAMMAVGCAVASIDPGWARARHLRAAAVLLLTAMFANACLWFNASVDVRNIQEQVGRLASRPKMLVLSAAATIGHPMVRSLNGVWISRQEAFWVREIVRRALADRLIDQAAAARLSVYIARERAGIIEDFRKQPPDIVLIDNRNSDWGQWAAADAELSALLSSYTRVQTVDGIDILQRTDMVNGRAPS